MTDEPIDNDTELFVTIAEMIDEHSLAEVLQKMAIYCEMQSEDKDNCGHCRALAELSAMEIGQLVERMEQIGGMMSGGRCDGPVSSDN